ncbi:MAG: CRISPR-associated endonuclease Cas2 [Clostridium sp.]|nr:CRISPR-associated endonuclease Cas2 [Clostridium sp.]
MFLILVYDVGQKRCNKVLKICRKYLNWVQNSVLEGEISKASFERLKSEIKKVIYEDEDSIIFYILRTTKYSERQTIGIKKGGDDMFI